MPRILFVSIILLLGFSGLVMASELPSVPTGAELEVAAFGTDDVGLPQTALQQGGETVDMAGGCSASADCWDGSTRSCSGGSGSTCTAVDSNCNSNVDGYAQCGSSTYSCPPCPTCYFNGASCTSSAFCASKCDLVCGLPYGSCVNGHCQCEDP